MKKNILYPDQQIIANDIYQRLERKELFNIPTGRGKTFIFIDVALRVIENDERSVIISVPDNYLVRNVAEVLEKYFDFYDYEIKIGADNYINLERLRELLYMMTDEAQKYFDITNAKEFLKKNKMNSDIFFEDFFQEVPLKDIAFESVVRNKICRLSNPPGFGSKPLIITNHFYILTKTIYSQNFDIGEYTLLFDEVHTINDIAEQILTDNFSFFEYKNTLNSILSELKQTKKDWHGKQKLMKTLQTQAVRAYHTLKKETSPELIDKYEVSGERFSKVFKESIKLLDNDHHRYLNKIVNKNELLHPYKGFFNKTSEFLVTASMRETSSASISSLYGVYFSPSRGYPTVRVSKANPLGKLHATFWKKISSFAGVSGSCTCSFSPSIHELRYGYLRLGMLEKDDKRDILFYDRIFPRENVRILFMHDTGSPEKESVYDEDFDKNNSPYYEWILSSINATHDNKNALILCGGYKECEYLAGKYSLIYGDRKVHYANPKEKRFQTIERFKKEGGVLFATKDYGVGVSLEGKLLEKLYILRYPYPDFTTKKWQDMRIESSKKFSHNYKREMLISLIQNLGRLQRTKDDKGDIFIFANTSKVNKNQIYSIAKEYGIIQENRKSPIKQKEYFEKKNKAEEVLNDLF